MADLFKQEPWFPGASVAPPVVQWEKNTVSHSLQSGLIMDLLPEEQLVKFTVYTRRRDISDL